MHDSIDEEGGRAPDLTRRYPALDIATNPSQYGGAHPIDVECRHIVPVIAEPIHQIARRRWGRAHGLGVEARALVRLPPHRGTDRRSDLRSQPNTARNCAEGTTASLAARTATAGSVRCGARISAHAQARQRRSANHPSPRPARKPRGPPMRSLLSLSRHAREAPRSVHIRFSSARAKTRAGSPQSVLWGDVCFHTKDG